jgi:MFS family permease
MREATSGNHSHSVHRDRLRRGLRASTVEGMLAMPIVTMSLPVNIFITALVTKGVALSKPTIGNLSSLPFVCNFLQVFYSPVIDRWMRAKSAALIFATLHIACWLWLGWRLPSLPLTNPMEVGKVLLPWFFIASICNASLGVVWNSWMHELVPPRLRGRYFGQRNRYCQGATLAFVLITGFVLSWGGYTARIFQLVIGVACLFRLASLYFFWLMPAGHRSVLNAPVSERTLPEQVRIVARDRPLLLFIAFGAIWSFAANCFGPFYPVFLFEKLDFSGTQVGLLATLSALGGVLCMPVWGQLLDRFGNKAVMTFALGLWQLQNLCWCILTPENSWLLYGMWLLAGSWSAGFVLGQFTILLKIIPPEAKNLSLGLNLAVTSAVAAISPVIGGQVLDWAFAQGYAPLTVYHAVFLVQPVVAMLGSLLLLKLHEPAASELSTVVGAMRNIRTLSGVMGLSFLVNYLFVKPERRRR